MTAWPLNCAAAHAAEMVFWRRGGDTRHALMIDTPAVPLRFETDGVAATSEALVAPAERPQAQRQMFVVRELKPR